MSLRLRDLQQILDKFTNGNKGTAISDCFIYMENDRGGLNEIGRIELQHQIEPHPTHFNLNKQHGPL